MGERVNYVLVDGGTTEVYYAPWGARAIDLDLVAGPELARRRIRYRGRPAEVLLDAVWCEAAVLVDEARRILALYTWHCEDYAHRAALRAVLAETWPGWDLRWTYGGIDEVAAYVGGRVGPDHRSEPPYSVAPVDPADLDECNLLVTVAEADGAARAYAMWDDVTDAFWVGPTLLAGLPESARVTALPRLPDSGLHLDPAARTVSGWTTLELAGLAEGWSHHWPGWRFEFSEDRYEEQVARCGDGLRVPEPVLAAGLDVLSDRIAGETAPEGIPADFGAARAAIARVRDRGAVPPRWPGLQRVFPNG